MTENKRFTLKHYEDTDWAYDNGKSIYVKEMVELLNALHEENQLLKQRLQEQNDINWLRNNTVWEQMPTSRKSTSISTGKILSSKNKDANVELEDIIGLVKCEPTNSVKLKKELYK